MKKTAFIFILLSGLASFFNYAVYPILARILDQEEFISITLALAIFTQLSSFTLAIVALTVGLSKQKNESNAKEIIEKLQSVVIHLFIILMALFIIFSPLYFKVLRIDQMLLLPICAMLLVSIVMSVVSGYLNGKQRLVKLGLILVLYSLLQLVLSSVAGLATKSGSLVLYSMALGAAIAVSITYVVYRNEGLPRIYSIFIHKLDIYRSKKIRKLVLYTLYSSIAILIMNILLIYDLFIINSRQVDVAVYTDIYVISRIVFFAGMLFIWPFLSEINIREPRKNSKILLRISLIFSFISALALALIYLFGNQITELLLDKSYSSTSNFKELAVLAILYKFLYLLITALTLYFIAIRSRWALIIVATLIITSLGATQLISPSSSTSTLLIGLNVAALLGLVVGISGYVVLCSKQAHISNL